ncbi:MAG: ABC transporter permease [Bifidobacteriaceae bacterium]|jgi:teichoic acid transport system permease protein|nr:ABC transporter permease [Bifidobacteriaceae bacterium]
MQLPSRPVPLSSAAAAALASRHGLRKLGARPRLGPYTVSLWRRRDFTWVLATSDAYGKNQGSYLGQLWGVLKPLLQVGVFYLIFGILITGTRQGIDDFLSYLVIGTFLFEFIASGLNNGGRAIASKIKLVRALEFPRAVLPISVTLTEMIMMWPAMVIMIVIVLVKGHTPTWSWLALIPALLLIYAFVLGCGFFLARIVSATPDLGNLVPILTQMARYVAGVFFSLEVLASGFGLLGQVAIYEPFALYLTLARSAILPEIQAGWGAWGLGLAYSMVTLVSGYIFFWLAEARYGRD